MDKSQLFTHYNHERARIRRGESKTPLTILNRALGVGQRKYVYRAYITADSPGIGWCTCPDWFYRSILLNRPCKHVLELRLEKTGGES